MQSSPISGQVQERTAMSGAQRRANAKINQMLGWLGRKRESVLLCLLRFPSSGLGSAWPFFWKGEVSARGATEANAAVLHIKGLARAHGGTRPELKRPTKKQTPPFVLGAPRFWLERGARREDGASRRPWPLHPMLWVGTWDTEGTGGCQSAGAQPGNLAVGGAATAARQPLMTYCWLALPASGDTYWRWRVAAQVCRPLRSVLGGYGDADAPPPPAELCERFSLWWSREAIVLSRRLKIAKWENDEKEEKKKKSF